MLQVCHAIGCRCDVKRAVAALEITLTNDIAACIQGNKTGERLSIRLRRFSFNCHDGADVGRYSAKNSRWITGDLSPHLGNIVDESVRLTASHDGDSAQLPRNVRQQTSRKIDAINSGRREILRSP